MGDINQLPFTSEHKLNQFKTQTQLRREDIAKSMALTGIDNTRRRCKALSEKHQVSTTQIYNDINWIVGHWKPENLREVKINLKIGRERALQEALELVNEAKDPKLKAQAIQTLNQTLKLFREELEEWGEKTKVADKQDVNITGYKFELIRENGSKNP